MSVEDRSVSSAEHRRFPAVARAAVLGSLALHAASLFAAARIVSGADVARASSGAPLVVHWTSTPPACDDVAPVCAVVARDAVPPPVAPSLPEIARLDECATLEPPTPTRDLREAPIAELRRDYSARIPSRRRGGGSSSAGGATSLGVGVGGTGGAGGPSAVGGGAGGFGGTGAGVGIGDGVGDGPESVAAACGATRGPTIVGALAAPTYPAKARSRGWEGRVVLLLSIDARGRVVAADVAESSGRPALDQAALEAARDWTFAPALENDAPVAGTLRVPVKFELTD